MCDNNTTFKCMYFTVFREMHSIVNKCSIYTCSCLVTVLSDPLCPYKPNVPGSSVLHYQSLSLLKFLSFDPVMLSNHLILCWPLLCLPLIFPSIRVFSSESAFHIKWPKYWSFSFSISPSNEYSELISFKINWFDILIVQGTLNSLQHHSSKASILQRSAFFTAQLSHPYMTTGKTIALTIWTLLAK